MNKPVSTIVSNFCAFFVALYAGIAVLAGDVGHSAIALAIVTLAFKLEALLLEFKDIMRR